MLSKQTLNALFVTSIVMLVFSFFNTSRPQTVNIPPIHETHATDSQRYKFQFGKLHGSIALKGLIIDELYMDDEQILHQKNGTKIIPIWEGIDVNIDHNTIWSISEINQNTLLCVHGSYKVELIFDESSVSIMQYGGSEKYCKMITTMTDGDRTVALLDQVFHEDLSHKVFKGSGWVAADSKYISRILRIHENAYVLYNKYDNNVSSVKVENKHALNLLCIKKDIQTLHAYHLDQLVNFGNYVWWITKPSFYLIDFLYNLFHSFGLSIIMFCIITRLIAAPISWNVFISMRRMQLIQPKINMLKKRHEHDPNALRIELANLFKQEKVNPLYSIFGLLIQLPILIALFSTFPILYHAYKAQFLWLNDLSESNLIMFVITCSSTLVSMLNVEQTQERSYTMFVFPAVFALFTYNLASGLMLGIFMNNILMLLQTSIFKLIIRR